MKVWIENPFDSLPVEGYRKQRYWMMAEAFVRAGHEVVYWTSDFSHAKKLSRGLESKSYAGFELKFIKTLPYRKNVSWARVRSHRAYAREWERQVRAEIAAGTVRRPDVIIVSAPPLATGEVAIRLARQFGAKFVVDVQDAWPETFVRLLPRGFRWLGGLLFRGARTSAAHLYRAADLVTGVCDRYAELVKGYGAGEYFRAYLGVERVAEAPDRGVAGTGTVRLVYVGNMGRSYDLKTVVEGVRILRARGVDVTLDIAGFGGEAPCAEGVRFHGMLGHEALQRLLADCEIGIIPMRSDSFVGIPNKLGEYASAGLRIVSSLAGETERLIAKYNCGATYCPGDAAGFADAVAAALGESCGSSRALAENELLAETIYRDYVLRVRLLV